MISMRFFNIMHGRDKSIFNGFTYVCFFLYHPARQVHSEDPVLTDLERTRFRKKPQLGKRLLVLHKINDFNAWDNVPWDEEKKAAAMCQVSLNSKTKVASEKQKDLEDNADKYWDAFYDIHDNKFFKDRHWLFTEFPELDPTVDAPLSVKSLPPKSAKDNLKIFEIGCGVGNTVFPILRISPPERKIFVYASDFSEKAISILKESPDYDTSRCSAFVLDATADDWNPPFVEESLDIVVFIFALSAINPEKFSHVVKNIKRYLAPGGLVLFRDYGRYDLAQLRFKDGKCLSDNFYMRGDGTRVYFFTQEDLRELFVGSGFVEEQNIVDRRLQVNRSKKLQMYRVWVQAKYRKPLENELV